MAQYTIEVGEITYIYFRGHDIVHGARVTRNFFMKTKLALLAFAVMLLSGMSFADPVPMDQFVYQFGDIATLTFELPASVIPDSSDDPFHFFTLHPDVSLSRNGIPIAGADGLPTIPFALQVFNVASADGVIDYRFFMGCGEAMNLQTGWDYCFIRYWASFDSPIVDLDTDTFILGAHDNGNSQILITAVPEEPAVIESALCLVFLVFAFIRPQTFSLTPH